MHRPGPAIAAAFKPLATPEQVMELLGYSDRGAFMRMARRSGLQRVRINARVIRFEWPAVDAWLRRRTFG